MAIEQKPNIGENLESAKREANSLAGEVSSLADEFLASARLEGELAKAETREQAKVAAKAAGFGIAAFELAVLAVTFAALTFMFILSVFLPFWLAGLITTLLLAPGAYLCWSSLADSARQFSPIPKRFLRTVKEDFRWA